MDVQLAVTVAINDLEWRVCVCVREWSVCVCVCVCVREWRVCAIGMCVILCSDKRNVQDNTGRSV